MNIRRGMAVVAPMMVLAIAGTACGAGGDSDGEGDSSSRLVYGESTDWPSNLFPIIASGNALSTQQMLVGILPSVFKTYPDFTVKPDMNLVTEEPTSTTSQGEKQVVTYTLHPDAVWSDGDPINAEDFRYTWEIQRSSDPTKGGCSSILGTTGYEQMESVKGSDDGRTVTVTYSTPFADWKNMFAPIFPQHLMDKGDPKKNCETVTAGWAMADGIVGEVSGGPWQLKKDSIDVGRKVVSLTPNERYWGEQPKLERLIYQAIGNEPGTMVKSLESGEVQMIYPQPQLDLVQQVRDLEPDVVNEINFGLSFEHFDFNTRNPHLAHKEIRQAFALALDRADMVKATVGAFDTRAQVLNNRIFVNNQPQYQDNAPKQYNTQNIDEAKRLIESVGYTMGPGGIYQSPTGETLTLEISTTEQNPLRQNTVELAIGALKKAGIEATMFLNPDIFAGADKPKSLEAGGFDVALFGWVTNPFVTPNIPIYRSVQGDSQGQNYTHGSDPKVDQLLAQMASATDEQKQADLANQVDAQLWQDMFTLPLYQKPTFLAFDSGYEGIADNATNAGPLWNSETFAIKE